MTANTKRPGRETVSGHRALSIATPVVLSMAALVLIGQLWSRAGKSESVVVPLGLPPLSADQLPVASEIELGRKLFFDRRLSFNTTNSCAMCHIESQGFTSNQSATAVGMEGRSLNRNASSLYNVAYQTALFHDGRESSLDRQAWEPLLSPLEMANPSVGSVVDRVRSLADYRGLFEAAFDGRGASMETIGEALASYQRTLLAGNSRFDRWHYGRQKDALSAREIRGFEVFTGKGRCSSCHLIEEKWALFTDRKYHVTGIGYVAAVGSGSDVFKVQLAPGVFIDVRDRDIASVRTPLANDIGRFAVTQDPKDRWAYKTPSLRNVELTYPYMHNGSLSTLEDVVAFYDQGGVAHDGVREIETLGLSAEEKADLVAFLKSLTTEADRAKHVP